MLEISIANSMLLASQRGMQVTGNNVANASTPGYHRQIIQFAAQQPMELDGQSYGRGVEITDVQRAYSDQLESAITAQTTRNGYVDSLKTSLAQLQSSLPTDASSISSLLGNVFNGMQQASSQLGNIASRKMVIANASVLAQQFNTLAANMDQMRTSVDAQITATIDATNPLLSQIADLNAQIASITDQGISPNDLIDTRDQLINTVAEKIAVEVQPGVSGQVTLLQSGTPLVIGGAAQKLHLALNSSGKMVVSTQGGKVPLSITEGALGGLLDVRDHRLPDVRQNLDTLARSVAQAFDEVQATGLGVDGGFTQLTGQRSVLDVTVPLNAAGASFPPRAGSLFVTMTNSSTGQKTMTEVKIDPATQSLNDLAASIGTTVPNLQVFVSKESGTMTLLAAPGYKVDFAGGIDPNPTTSFSAGTTAKATMGGEFTGGTNDAYTYTFLSSGTVGVTPGMQARVTDQAGNVLGTYNVGQGYEAGQPIEGPNGVTLTLSTGDVTAGDSLTAKVVGQPDSSGILTTLGINSFFSGIDAGTLKVNSLLTSNPNALATSRSGQPGDTSNLQRFVDLQDQQRMASGTETMSSFFNQMVADVGTQVSSLDQQSSTNQILTTRLKEQQQSVSGVNVNEEMLNIIKYQQMFQSAAKYVSAVNDMYQQLFHSI